MTPKKLLALMLAMTMSAAMLTACGDSDDDDDDDKPGYEVALDSYFDGICKQSGEKIFKVAIPDNVAKYLMEEFDYSKSELVDGYTTAAEYIYERLEDDFGDNIKISYKIDNKDKFDKDDLADVEDELNDRYDDEISFRLKEGYELDLELTIRGSDDREDEIEAEATVIQINGDWIIMELDCDDYYFGI